MTRRDSPTKLVPGLLLLVVLGVVAQSIPGVNALLVAIVLGAVFTNLTSLPDRFTPGLAVHPLFLETGIVLLGASVSLDEMAASGVVVALLVVATVATGLLTVELLSRRVFDVGAKTGSVLAAGSSICGVSAATAIAGSIEAKSEQLTHAVATILLFDAVTLVAFPAVSHWVTLSPKQFGVWVGLSMFSTGPVAAAGFAHSSLAGQWATVTKLTRNSLLGVVALGYTALYVTDDDDGRLDVAQLWNRFPKFLVGFFVVALVSNLGVLSAGTLTTVAAVGDWLFVFAFVGLGFSIRLSQMRETGLKPVSVVLCYLLLISVLTFGAVSLLL
ncbi:MAG: YeiH family protein [Halobacteriota archaeon]